LFQSIIILITILNVLIFGIVVSRVIFWLVVNIVDVKLFSDVELVIKVGNPSNVVDDLILDDVDNENEYVVSMIGVVKDTVDTLSKFIDDVNGIIVVVGKNDVRRVVTSTGVLVVDEIVTTVFNSSVSEILANVKH
jgi:hypothetical protein